MLLLLATPAAILHLDAVQRRLASIVSNELKNNIQIPFEVSSININFPNKLTIDSILINDLIGDTIASIPRISASFDIIPFIRKGNIKIHTIKLSAPDIRLSREDSLSPLNIQFILDKLSTSDSTSGKTPDIHINQIHIYDGHISYHVLSEEEKDNFDPSNIEINNLQANIALRAITNDSLSLYIRKIAFDEKSGLAIKRLKAEINANLHNAHINRLYIATRNSNISSNGIDIKFPEKATNSKPFFSGELQSNKLSIKEFAPLMPQLSHMNSNLKLSTKFTGSDNSINIKKFNISSDNNHINLNLSGGINNISTKKPQYELKIKELSATPDFITSVYAVATNGAETPRELTNLGRIHIKGNLKGSGKQANGSAEITSEAGYITAKANIEKNGEYNATLSAQEINIGKITDDKNWGFCGLNANIIGNTTDSTRTPIKFTTTITPLQYKEYTYAPININGTYTNKNLVSYITLNDQNIQINNTSIKYDGNKPLPVYELKMQVDSFSPYNLGLTKIHEGNFLSFRISSKLIGNDPENSSTNTIINDFTLKTPTEESKIREFILSTNTLEKKKILTVTSDFLNGHLTGIYSYKTLANSLKLAMQRVAPSLFDNHEVTTTNNDFSFDISINNTSTLTKIFNLPVTVKKLSLLQGSCNDTHKLFSLSGRLKGIDYGKRKYKSIDFYSQIDEKENKNNIQLVRSPLPDETDYYNPQNDITINIITEAANDTLLSNIKWKNLYTPTNKGDVKFDLALQRNNDNKLNVTALLHKGEITQSDTTWQLSPSKISTNNDVITIENFSLQSNSQYLRVDGNIGESPDDNLDIDLRHINMEYVFDILDFHPVNLGGEVSGNIHASSLLKEMRFNSNLQIKNLTFEHGLIGDLAFNGYWDEEQKAIILKGDAREGNESRTIVDGFVSPERDTLNICIEAQKTRIDFLNHLLSSFIGDASGRVSGKLYILGALRDVNMQGALAPLGQLKIKPTNTIYNLIGDTIHFTHNKIGFEEFHIKDNYGNSGAVTGGVYHQSLKRFTCDFRINAHNLLAFNYSDFGEETFYGTAFVTGSSELKINSSGIKLSANVTTNPNSKFIYNASSPEGNISNEFVKFIDRRKRKSLITDLEIFQEEETPKNINSELNLDFMIDVTPDMQLRVYTNQASNDYIDIYGSGTINAIYDEKAGFTMKGNLGLIRGTYKFTLQDIFPKEFDIRTGSSIDFNGDPFNANLNLKTVYNIPSVPLTDLSIDAERRKNVKVNCYMDITGTIFNPGLKFDLDLPDGNEEEKELLASAISTPEQLNMQFIYLLGIGKFYTYDYNNQRAESQSSTAMESLISNTISGQLNNMLSQIIDDSNWNISGNFTTSEKGWNSMEVEGMLSGRLLDNRLLINGNLGYRDNPIANKNFIGDFEVQWLLNKSGNISLKAYNKTNDRYFSKTTLTTQGAGILLKRDFDGWKFWQK